MNDMSSVIVPKSDQINADTLLAGPMTVTIREVQIRGGQEQPVSIMLDETDLAYRPCKSMSRVLVQAWGPDAKVYVGRSLTLYRDPTVKWGGMEVGGIRISHMSHIDGKLQMQLTATKGQRKPHIVMPLVASQQQQQQKPDAARNWASAFVTQVNGAPDTPAFENFVAGKAAKLEELKSKRPEIHAECEAAIVARRAALASTGDDFSDDEPFDTQTGELPDEPTPAPETDWLAKAQELRGGIRNAKSATYLAAVRESYRAVCTAMPKALADEIEALLLAKDAELADA